jgi:hypothetical protein
MAVVSCEETYTMDADKTIPGRCRLYGIVFSTIDTSGRIYTFRVGSVYNRTLVFQDGSSSGSTMLEVEFPLGVSSGWGCGIMPYTFMFGNRSILFPNGIYVPVLSESPHATADPQPDETSLTIYYEGA